nr:unnamed protein product [Digitaria exilis]
MVKLTFCRDRAVEMHFWTLDMVPWDGCSLPDAIQIYVQEAKWSNDKYIPTFKEHTEVSLMSSWASTLCLVASAFAEDDVLATEQAVQWGLGMPDMYMACAEITRFRNDVASYQEHGVTGDEAAAAITAMVELSWRRINQGCLEMDRALLPAAARPVVGMSREVEVIYLDGRDGYTFGSDINHIIDRLFVDPVPV